MSDSTSSTLDHNNHVSHDVPLSVLISVFVALLLLTFATVAVTWVDLGGFSVPVALAIACIKATLVALFFMHLAYDKPFNTVILVVTVFFVVFFIALATLDVASYRSEVDAFRQAHPDRVVPAIDNVGQRQSGENQ